MVRTKKAAMAILIQRGEIVVHLAGLLCSLCRNAHFRLRQTEPERRAMAQFTGHPRLSAVVENNMLHDGETQSRAAGLARASFVHAVEALEQARQMLGRNSWSVVADEAFNPPITLHCTDLYSLAARPILQSVVDQVGKNLMNGIAVSKHLHMGKVDNFNGNAFAFCDFVE